MTIFRIRWKLGIVGQGTPDKGIYTNLREAVGDFKQCVFLQPENQYVFEASDDDGESWYELKVDIICETEEAVSFFGVTNTYGI